MKFIVLLISIATLISCNKDKFTSVPQIEFKSLDFNQGNSLPTSPAPHVILEVRDSEGDIGFNTGKDTAKIYLRNTLTNKMDSLIFPNLGSAAKKNFEAEISVSLFGVMGGRSPGPPRPFNDTLFFEIYVTDFAKNKSNVIVTETPFIYTTL